MDAVTDHVSAEVEPVVVDGRWAEAVLALAGGLAELSPPEETPVAGEHRSNAAWSGTAAAWAVAAVVVALAGGHVLGRRSGPRRTATPAESPDERVTAADRTR